MKKTVSAPQANLLLLTALIFASTAALAKGLLSRHDALTVNLTVVDDIGVVVPYASVGSTWIPYGAGRGLLTPEEMWSELTRNPPAWEYWNKFYNGRDIKFAGLTSTAGRLTEHLDYEDDARQPRPEDWILGYAAYRQGYEPGQVMIRARKDDKRLDLKIVLKRAADYRPQDPPYIRTLHEVRIEINNSRANESVTRKNQQRLEGLRQRLEAAAEQALNSDDSKSAAKIYFWVAHLPEIKEREGNLVGYTQTNTESPRNVAAMEKAANLDPANIVIQDDWICSQSIVIQHMEANHEITEEEWVRRREVLLERALALDRVAGSRSSASLQLLIANTASFFGYRAEKAHQFELAYRYYLQQYSTLLLAQANYPHTNVADDLSVARDKMARVKESIK